MICAGLLLEIECSPSVFVFTTFNVALKYAGTHHLFAF